MPFVDTNGLKVIEPTTGMEGTLLFTRPAMTFAHYEFAADSKIREHLHPEEEVYEVIEGELELTIDEKTEIARPAIVAIVAANI
jgi:quercetin dioxygenase-like cupin family protein